MDSSLLGKLDTFDLQNQSVSLFLDDVPSMQAQLHCLQDDTIYQKITELKLHTTDPPRYDKCAQLLNFFDSRPFMYRFVVALLNYFEHNGLLRETFLEAVNDRPIVASLIGMPGNFILCNIDFCLLMLDNNPSCYEFLPFNLRSEPAIILRFLELNNTQN